MFIPLQFTSERIHFSSINPLLSNKYIQILTHGLGAERNQQRLKIYIYLLFRLTEPFLFIISSLIYVIMSYVQCLIF